MSNNKKGLNKGFSSDVNWGKNTFKKAQETTINKDYKKLDTGKSEKMHNFIYRVGDQIAGATIRTVGSSVDGDDYGLYRTTKQSSDTVKSGVDTLRIVTDVPNQIFGGIDKGLKANDGRRNASLYLKGEQTRSIREFKSRSHKGQRKYIQSNYGDLLSLKKSQVNKDFASLHFKKVSKMATPEELTKLQNIMNYKKANTRKKVFERRAGSYKNTTRKITGSTRKVLEKGDIEGQSQLFATYDFATNKYVKKTGKGIARVTYHTVRLAGVGTVKGVSYVAKKTGVDKKLVAQGKKISNSDIGTGVKNAGRFVKNEVHGGTYKRVVKGANKIAPDKVKKGYKKYQEVKGIATGAAGKAGKKIPKVKNNTVNSFIGKSLGLLIKGLAFIKNAIVDIMAALEKAIKDIIGIIVLALLLVVLIIGVIPMIISPILTMIMIELDDFEHYVGYMTTKQNELQYEMDQGIAEAIEKHDSLNGATWNYTHKATLDNTKEILSMAAVYKGQNWPAWIEFNKRNEMKDYLDQLFEDSHSYHIEPGEVYECDGCKERKVDDCKTITTEAGLEETFCTTSTEKYCDGHRDIEITLTSMGFDDIYEIDSMGAQVTVKTEAELDAPVLDQGNDEANIEPEQDGDENNTLSDNWPGWTDDNRQWVQDLYDANWYELYGVMVGGGGSYVPLTQAEIDSLFDNMPEDVSKERKDLILQAAQGLNGNIPYYWNWRSYYTIKPGLEDNQFGQEGPFDEFGRTEFGLDCSGYVIWSFLSAGYDPNDIGWTYSGNTTSIYYAKGTRLIPESELQVGDLGMLQINAGKDNHVGIYVGNGQWIHSSGRFGVNISSYNWNFFLRVDALDN